MIPLSHALDATAGGRPVLVMRPDPSPDRGSVEMLATLARARVGGSAACFLPPPGDAGALVTLATSRDVPLVAGGWRQPWFRVRWTLASLARRGRGRWRAAVASGLQEIYRELRRQAGHERLPAELRRRLREMAHGAYDRALSSAPPMEPYPRRLLRDPSAFALPPSALDGARGEAEALGFVGERPTVLLEGGMRPDLAAVFRRRLGQRGYRVVELRAPASLRVMLFLLCASRFVAGWSRDLHQLAHLTNTPALTVHATDVFEAYPVRKDGLFLLRPAVDLETGQEIPLARRLSEGYYRNLRNVGFREHPIAEIDAAIGEMVDGVEHGWQESENQSRFRDRALTAGTTLAPSVPSVAAWGPDAGFLGDGRLARVQADEP